ncbi:MAG: acyltransferase family protein [Bradymonadia bacterium]
MKYRPEIDGLRAVAVLPVILFHAGLTQFSGGFVGVDVFFVISGYLISTILMRDLARGKLSILEFYERRARRILPALFVVILATLPFAWMWLLPSDLKDYGQSITATAAFGANILFWRESGYFDTAAEFKPLLHMWSLGVEEQYYVIFPLLLLAVWKLGRAWLKVTLALIFVASLVGSQWSSVHAPSANFFMLHTRAWELLIGVFAALYLNGPEPRTPSRGSSAILSGIGLVLIGVSIFAFDESTPFPSVYALVPTVGTVLIILFAVPGTPTHRLLSLRPMVGVGLISYSAYLWHQPILVFARHASLEETTISESLALSALSMVLAYLTWRFVEAPFRERSRFKGMVLPVSTISLVLFGVLGYGIAQQAGGPLGEIRLTDHNVMAPPKFPGIRHEGRSCNRAALTEDAPPCRIDGAPEAEFEVVIVGDSHGRVLSEALHRRLHSVRRLTDLTRGGCPFVLGLDAFIHRGHSQCDRAYQQRRADVIAQSADVKRVTILQARHPLYVTGDGFDNGVGGIEKIARTYVADAPLDPPEKRQVDYFASLERSIEHLSANSALVVVFLSPHTNGWDPVERMWKLSQRGLDLAEARTRLSFPYASVDARVHAVDQVILDTAARLPNVMTVDPKALTCPVTDSGDSARRCTALSPDGLLYFSDEDHLALIANEALVEEVMRRVSTRLGSRQ